MLQLFINSMRLGLRPSDVFSVINGYYTNDGLSDLYFTDDSLTHAYVYQD